MIISLYMISQPVCNRTVWFFAVRFYYRCFTICDYPSWYYDNILSSRLLRYYICKCFFGHPFSVSLIFANSASSVWSSKHINMFGQVHGLVWCILHSTSLKCCNKVRGDWKRVGCHGNTIFKAVGVSDVDLFACQLSLVSVSNWPR